MYPVERHSIRQVYQSFQANTLKDVQENPFLALLDKLLRCALVESWAVGKGVELKSVRLNYKMSEF